MTVRILEKQAKLHRQLQCLIFSILILCAKQNCGSSQRFLSCQGFVMWQSKPISVAHNLLSLSLSERWSLAATSSSIYNCLSLIIKGFLSEDPAFDARLHLKQDSHTGLYLNTQES